MARKRKKISRVKSLRDLDFEGPRIELSGETKRWIFIILLFVFGVLSILSLFNSAGTLGVYFNYFLTGVFGVTKWIMPLIFLAIGYFLFRPAAYGFKMMNIIGLVIFTLSLNGLIHLIFHHQELVFAARQGAGGGYLGLVLSVPFLKLMGFWASLIVLLALTAIGFILLFEKYIASLIDKRRQEQQEVAEEIPEEVPAVGLFDKLSSYFNNRRLHKIEASRQIIKEEEEEEVPEFIQREVDVEQHGSGLEPEEDEFDDTEVLEEESKEDSDEHHLSIGAGKFKKIRIDLPVHLLDGKTTAPKGGDIVANKLIIQKTLKNFGIMAEMGEAKVGPTVTQYTLKPAEGVRLSKITGLSDNLALALAAHPIRIEAPVPGKSLVGIEVPNEAKASVPLSAMLTSPEFKSRESNLALALGKDVMGRATFYPLDRMPHLLIAGTTGSGKSVCINTIILSLLFQNGPGDLKLIMVDPKRVELPLYNGIPHLLTPVITDVKKTINALRWTIKEMEQRFDLLSKAGHRNIASYNEANEEKLPYIVFIIDELADIMAVAGHEVEAAIVRLAQMSRAVGIHLVLATQRPSVDVITGLIKANVPARVAFSVASLVDSRTILDQSGAEKLLGKGDMLFVTADISKPRRLQGAFASDKEIKRVIDHLKQQADPDYVEEVTEKQMSTGLVSAEGTMGDEEDDPLLREAKDVIFKAKKASASLLQRRLRIGYSRAARILDLLEEQGFIGPADGARPREVLGSSLESNESLDREDVVIEEAEDDFPEDDNDYLEDMEENNNSKNSL